MNSNKITAVFLVVVILVLTYFFAFSNWEKPAPLGTVYNPPSTLEETTTLSSEPETSGGADTLTSIPTKIESCLDYCLVGEFSHGMCTRTKSECNGRGGVIKIPASRYCDNPNVNNCCCFGKK
ncbi:MAG: hypothetical protein V1921_00345 [Candidatus Altiarchaeota archaeon]